jgi:hypothetical protein
MRPGTVLSIHLVALVHCAAFAAEFPRSEVEVTMFAVPEKMWQERFEGKFQEHPALWLRLNGDAASGLLAMPVDFKFRLVGDEAVVQRKGEEQKFVESWRTWRFADSEARADKTTTRFIGTSVQLAQEETSQPGPLRLKLDLEHHVAPPTMRRINYANAATGAERNRLSVEYPQFEKVEWHGELTVWREWRLVANLLHLPVVAEPKPAGPPTRYLIFIKRA